MEELTVTGRTDEKVELRLELDAKARAAEMGR